MSINDYRCIGGCNNIMRDLISKPEGCSVCGGPVEVYFGNWDTVSFDARKDELTDSKGMRKGFGALEDPLCVAQLGLGDSKLQSYCRVTSEKQKELQERLVKDGDSPKFRKDILEAYNDATGKKFEVQRD